jgi:signal peptidase I
MAGEKGREGTIGEKNMSFNFELILFYATVIAGMIALFDVLFLARARTRRVAGGVKLKLPVLIDYARSFFPILLIVFLIRSFIFEPFRIPSGSLEPTLAIGDFILVNKYHYGIRLPVIHKKIFEIEQPKRGDIIVFRWPPKPSVDFIKRVIGIPGDKISYIDKVLYVNGAKIPQIFTRYEVEENEDDQSSNVVEKKENLLGVTHAIFQKPARLSYDFHDITVPEGMYFVMGDNRDDSEDSRFWGFVPNENIVGKATYVWMSWNSLKYSVRWDRIGTKII